MKSSENMSNDGKKQGFYRPGEVPAEPEKSSDAPYSSGIALSKRSKRSEAASVLESGHENVISSTLASTPELPPIPEPSLEPICSEPETPCRDEPTYEPPVHTVYAPGSVFLSNNSKRKILIAIGAIGVVIAIILAIALTLHTVDKSCEWCGHRPSVAYKTSDGSDAYVCKDCSKRCALCGKKASRHYENLLGMVVFVCSDCYQEVSGD